MPTRSAISLSACGHLQRVRAAFELARAGDQRERQAIAEADAANGDDGVRGGIGHCGHGQSFRVRDSPLVPAKAGTQCCTKDWMPAFTRTRVYPSSAGEKTEVG